MDIGITGSRIGPVTDAQANKLRIILKGLRGANNRFHQGCCIGVDEESTMMAHKLKYHIIAHPPIKDTFLSEAALELSHEVLEPKDYLDRDLDIVNACTKLVVVPATDEEIRRSGTWYTFRRAREMHKPHIIVWPNGSTTEEN